MKTAVRSPTTSSPWFADYLAAFRPDRLWRLLGSVSVRTKILGMVLALTCLLGGVVTWQVRSVMTSTFMEELENRGLSVVSDLAARSVDPVLLNDMFALHRLLTETVANNPDVAYAFVQDDEGQVVAHTFGEQGFPVALLAAPFAQYAPAESDSSPSRLQYRSEQGVIHEFSAVIFADHAGHVRVGLSETRLVTIIDAVTGQLLITTLVVAVAGILAATLLTWLLTQPILDLVKTTRAVTEGNLEARAQHWADDEIGDLADAFNQMVDELAHNQRELATKEQTRTLLLHKLITAQEEERRRIARDLHDGVGQMLTSVLVRTRLLSQAESPPAAQVEAAELTLIATETLEQVRLLSRELRPSIIDDLGLVAALERYTAEFTRRYEEIAVDLHCDLPERLPSTMETALYRIVQEALTNAARHGGATSIGVLLSRRNGAVQTIVEDNGAGFDVDAVRRRQGSVGIFGMNERAELLGGTLAIESGPDGTTVYVEIPL